MGAAGGPENPKGEICTLRRTATTLLSQIGNVYTGWTDYYRKFVSASVKANMQPALTWMQYSFAVIYETPSILFSAEYRYISNQYP